MLAADREQGSPVARARPLDAWTGHVVAVAASLNEQPRVDGELVIATVVMHKWASTRG